ncbi:hypothetical protein CC86DRAFT_454045 [Ophiobolus disseminans]|uniref:Uncharacterized protein n=1 Tax=Ophiobolus disseminans TaxID=1469910 RepID=A0A6A7A9D7_9PLEO|nr:hypothetical protein CC86DRAFT_454045 [Ophiobolus disseminans]
MSELDDRYVYHGVWTNQKDGPIMGQTITTDVRTSIIIVALLAVMSTIGATHLWNLLLFALHQQRASGNPEDALFRQQQTLLRTLPAPGSFFTEAIKLWWIWRRKQGKVFLRCFLPALVSLLFAISTLTASVFSSAIVSSSDIEVLVDSPYCGFRNFTRYFLKPATGERNYVSTYEDIGEAYAKECYKASSASQSGCKRIFTQPRIPFTLEDAACPFAEKMCAVKGSSAIAMDSGLLDLNHHFGFNLGAKDGVKFRRKTTCSVMPVKDYVGIYNVSELPKVLSDGLLSQPRLEYPGEQVVATQLGGYVFAANGTNSVGLATKFQNITALTSLLFLNASTGRYQAAGIMTLANRDKVPFKKKAVYNYDPIPEIVRTDADVVLMVVSIGGVNHYEPVYDPLFAATREYRWSAESVLLYKADSPAGTMGCAVQYQACVNRPGQADSCTPLGPLSSNAWQEDFPEASSTQKLLLQLIGHASWGMDFGNLGTLNAASTLNRGIRQGLPDDQWKIEAREQESRVWAVLQILLADYAIGAQVTEPNAHGYVNPLSTAAEKGLCHAMRMKKSGGFANINVIGLALILALSSFFIIADLVVLRSLLYIPQLRRRLAPRIDRWVQDGVLQLQRRAYEAHMVGTWQDIELPIPTTVTLEKLPELPITSRPEYSKSDLELFEMRSRIGTSSTAATKVERPGFLEKKKSFAQSILAT